MNRLYLIAPLVGLLLFAAAAFSLLYRSGDIDSEIVLRIEQQHTDLAVRYRRQPEAVNREAEHEAWRKLQDANEYEIKSRRISRLQERWDITMDVLTWLLAVSIVLTILSLFVNTSPE